MYLLIHSLSHSPFPVPFDHISNMEQRRIAIVATRQSFRDCKSPPKLTIIIRILDQYRNPDHPQYLLDWSSARDSLTSGKLKQIRAIRIRI